MATRTLLGHFAAPGQPSLGVPPAFGAAVPPGAAEGTFLERRVSREDVRARDPRVGV